MKIHELKCWPEFFRPLASGEKTFEVRKDDRAFHAGDRLQVREWINDGTGYTGKELTFDVTYILGGRPWLEKDYVVMGLKPVDDARVGRSPGLASRALAKFKDGIVPILAEAIDAHEARGSNYVANDDTYPTKITFANGRTVEICGNGFLVVGMDQGQGADSPCAAGSAAPSTDPADPASQGDPSADPSDVQRGVAQSAPATISGSASQVGSPSIDGYLPDCPKCGKTNIIAAAPDWTDAGVTACMTCTACDHQWEQHWSLVAGGAPKMECPDCHGGGSVMNLSMPCLRCQCTGKVDASKVAIPGNADVLARCENCGAREHARKQGKTCCYDSDWLFLRSENGHVLWACRACSRETWSPGTTPAPCGCVASASGVPCPNCDGQGHEAQKKCAECDGTGRR